MKVLVSAFACNPLGDSEAFVGWQAVLAIAQSHDVCVVTGSRYRENVVEAIAAGTVPSNIHFEFHGTHRPWNNSRLRARIQSWMEYHRWNRTLLSTAKRLHREKGFDVIHHVTYSTWRVGSPLWKVGPPFVWGPVGGVATFPPQMFVLLSPVARIFEYCRDISNRLARLLPSIRQCVRNATVVVASNQETLDFLKPLRGDRGAMFQIWPAFFSKEKIRNFEQAAENEQFDAKLRIFSGGNLEGRKGVALGLNGLSLAKQAGIHFTYKLGGGGPEYEHLKQLAAQLGIESDVVFSQSLAGRYYQEELGGTHIYLLPSFRENIGLSMVEAMLAGCVPIVANASAQSEIVRDDCGFRIAVTTPEQMAREISDCVVLLYSDRELMRRLGQAARKRAAALFSEEKYRTSINEIYRTATGRCDESAG